MQPAAPTAPAPLVARLRDPDRSPPADARPRGVERRPCGDLDATAQPARRGDLSAEPAGRQSNGQPAGVPAAQPAGQHVGQPVAVVPPNRDAVSLARPRGVEARPAFGLDDRTSLADPAGSTTRSVSRFGETVSSGYSLIARSETDSRETGRRRDLPEKLEPLPPVQCLQQKPALDSISEIRQRTQELLARSRRTRS